MKRILITGGPTNEAIDEVMKITNMSTGKLSKTLSEIFSEAGYGVTFVANTLVYVDDIQETESFRILRAESTDDMMAAIYEESKKFDYDAVIHASAVGDYKSDFSFLMEDMALELFEMRDNLTSPEAIMEIMKNPQCKLDDSSKISSYQENLTVKLTLTPKIISKLREWFPDALLFGCKLLEDVSEEELFDVAKSLCAKNKMDYILANDLAKLRSGDSTRYPVTKKGYTNRPLRDAAAIFGFVEEKLNERNS